MQYAKNLVNRFNGLEEFGKLCAEFRCYEGIDLAFKIIKGYYGRSHRHYHNLNHIFFCLIILEGFSSQADNLSVLKLAIWFHDIEDTEEASVVTSNIILTALGFSKSIISRVSELIMDTKHPTCPTTNDGRLIHDLDLMGLGDTWENMQIICNRLRLESRHLSDKAFAQKQVTFFSKLLDWTLYTHPCFEKFEKSARTNINKELTNLKKLIN